MRIGILAAVCLLSIPLRAENPVKEGQDKFNLAVECIKRFEGWHGERKHWPYVGWGHKVLPGEKFTNNISKAQGDSILRADLRKLCPYRLLGYGKIPKSRLIKRLESGDRDIYDEYVSFRCYRGKVVPSIERRRKEEFRLLFDE